MFNRAFRALAALAAIAAAAPSFAQDIVSAPNVSSQVVSTKAAQAYRDLEINGNAASGVHNPSKTDIRSLWTAQDQANADRGVSVKDAGALADGVTDDTAAVQSVFTSVAASTGRVFFPCGSYKLTSSIAVTITTDKAFIAQGASSQCVKITFTNGGGFAVAQNSYLSNVSFIGLDIRTSRGAGSGSAIAVTNSVCLGAHPANVFRDLYIGGSLPTAATYWDSGLNLSKLSNVTIDNVIVAGDSGGAYHTNGVVWAGTATGGSPSGPCYAIIADIHNSRFFSVNSGIVMGAYAQGMTIDSTNVVNGVNGISTPTDTTNSNMLMVHDSQFNTSQEQIKIQGFLSNVDIHDNLIYPFPGFAGVSINGATGTQYNIHHNQFGAASGVYTSNNTIGVAVLNGADGLIQGNWYGNITIGNFLDTPSSDFRVDGNNYQNNGVVNPITNNGTRNLVDWSGPPTISACGTSPPTPASTSDNTQGIITTGTGTPTSCTISLANGGWPHKAACTISPANSAAAGAAGYISAQSLTAFTITQTAVSSAKYNYTCSGS